ncbi:MAG TPA: VanW family protein [Sandaracinaceae bacterium]
MARWVERARVALAVACLAAAGGLATWALAPRRAARASVAAPPAVVRVGTAEVEKGADPSAIAHAIAARWEEARVQLSIPDAAPIESTRRALGAHVDVERLTALLRDANDATSALRRVHAQLAPGRPVELPLPIVFDERAMFERLAELKDAYDRRPVDARVNPRTGEVVPHRHGRSLDVHATLDALHRALEDGAQRVRAVVRTQPAHRTTEDLDGLDLSHVLGAYETRYSTLEDARDRTFNLRVAASKIDGLVVLPGETFDFNEVVGERSEANGFRPAPVIAGGELIDGVGGGTCQVAGTLHAAAFFAGLPIVERSPHSRPSTYIFMGLDAVVAYPQLNFRFANDLPFPIAIGFTVEGGVARAEIRGARTNRMVSFVRRIDELRAYDEREVEDPSLPRGVRVLRQRGVPGFRITRWRIVRDVARNQAVRTRSEDVYPPTTQIWRVGTGGQAPEGYVPPEGDTHGEYTADEYLSVVQGVGVEGTQIVRRAGRSGTPGWTQRMGYPQPDPARFVR